MLVYEVLEYDVRYEKRRSYFNSFPLAQEFVRGLYGADVEFRPYHGDGPTGAFWFGKNKDGEDAGIIEAVWQWNRSPRPDEFDRVNRLVRWLNEDSEERLVRHLLWLRGEEADDDDDVEAFRAVVPERGTGLIEACVLRETEADFCGACPGLHGQHKLACAKVNGRLIVPAVKVREGSFRVATPINTASTVPAPPDSKSGAR